MNFWCPASKHRSTFFISLQQVQKKQFSKEADEKITYLNLEKEKKIYKERPECSAYLN